MTARRIHLLLIALWAVVAAPAVADVSGQFYFTAIMAPRESITGTAGQPNTVYLRWDSVEGEIPANVTGFTIDRDDGSFVVSFPIAPLDAASIEALYAPPDQDRRKAEIVSWLNREDASVTVLNFGTALAAKLTGDPQLNALWLGFGSRLDFNLAIARRRGYRDDTAPAGNVKYELIADTSAGPVRVGLLTVDTTATHLAPKGADFQQVELGRCDAPEVGKDQSAVALSWSIPEQDVDRYRNSLLIAGWDVWRRTGCSEKEPPWASAPPVDLRFELSTATHDAQGNPILPGYERVNDQPIVVSGGGPSDTEDRYKGYNSAYAQHYEPIEQVRDAGLLPGTTCPYYLVPRDVTGNYGETQEWPVTVPDKEQPPAPWVIETLTDNVNGELDITFDHVNIDNYYDDHQRGRTYCNLDTARFDRELRYVEAGHSCDTATQHRVKLDVVGYNVYRFRQPEDARNFTDSDGDGYGDVDERVPNPQQGTPGFETLTDPGTACDPNIGVGTYWRTDPEVQGLPYTITAVAPNLVQRSDGRLAIEFSDVEPASFPEDVYWYRVASIHSDGTISELSEPVRGLYHDIDPPAAPDCGVGDLSCAPFVTTIPFTSSGFPYAEDLTRDARWLRLSCVPAGVNFELLLSLADIEDPAVPGTLHYGTDLDPDACLQLVAGCGGASTTASFLDAQGAVIDETVLPTFQGCVDPGPDHVQLDENCTTRTVTRFTRQNESPRGELGFDCAPAGDCYRFFREVDGHSYPLATICDQDFPICFDGYLYNAGGGTFQLADCPAGFTEIPLPNIGGEPICMSVALVDANNLSSSKQHLPCLQTATPPPGPPQLLEFTFTSGTNNGQVRWVPPEQPVLGTLVEYYRADADDSGGGFRKTLFFEHPAKTAVDGPIAGNVLLDDPLYPSDPDWEEDWCFRARTIGRSDPGEEEDALSPWAGPRCDVRTAPGTVLPTYLGWPEIPETPEGSALLAKYLPVDGVTAIHLAVANACAGASSCAPTGTRCFPNLGSTGGSAQECTDYCNDLEAAVAGEVGFVAYRQERDSQGIASEFYQVSSYVPGLYCDQTAGVPQLLADPLIHYVLLLGEPPPWDQSSLVFLDRYPNVVGYDYRYQFLYFDSRGEILRARTSNWVTAVP